MTQVAPGYRPQRHHLDRHADGLAQNVADGDPDELLTQQFVANNVLHVSIQWLELGRAQGYGPPFVRLGPRTVRYRRKELVAWLRSRKPAPPNKPKSVKRA